MRPRTMRIIVVIVAAGMLFGARSAGAWVAVRVAPRVGAAAVGVAAGAVAGAAVASSYRPTYAYPTTTVVTPPPRPPAVGTVVTTLPSGCSSSGGRYQCGSVWYQPYFGGNGVYYQVVAP